MHGQLNACVHGLCLSGALQLCLGFSQPYEQVRAKEVRVLHETEARDVDIDRPMAFIAGTCL